MKSATAFRLWVMNMWQDNCAEHEAYTQAPMPVAVYWRQYKWWLKREYQTRNKP